MSNLTIKTNKRAIKARVRTACAEARRVISNEFLKDSNKYARHDTGEMIKSSIRSSNIDEGELIWDTPYARRVYYRGTPSTDKNPNASLQWARRAHMENKKKYKKMLEKTIGG